MGLAEQRDNHVTISYRGAAFTRLKDRNCRRMDEYQLARRIDVRYNSTPVEFLPGSAQLIASDKAVEVRSNFVWVFAGGTSPTDFLRASGIECGI